MRTATFLLVTLLIVPLSLVAADSPVASSGTTEILSFPLSSGSSIDLHITPEMRSHSYTRYALYFASNALALLILGLFLYLRFGGWMQLRMERLTRKPFVVALLTAAGILISGSLLTLPLAIYSGYVVPHEYGLSTQWLSGWLGEWMIGLVTEVVILSPLVALGLFAIRAFPRRWWIVIWAGSIPISILLVVVAPVVLDPLYNDFKPLRDASLRAELLQVAERAGIEGGRVYEVDKSKQTTTMNAYVTGIGPTKRIVLWDTLLQKMSRDEILVVMAHEMAHYTRQHIWKGLAFGYAVMFPCMAFGAWIIAAGVRRWGSRWGVASPDDPAAIPWLFAVAIGGMILLTPVFAAYSRTIEHEADVIALQLTGLREDAATAFVKFSEDSKSLPQPPAFIEYWYYTHPPLAKRIAFALGTEPVRKTSATTADADPVIARVGKKVLLASEVSCAPSSGVAKDETRCAKYQTRKVHEFIREQFLEASVREFGLDTEAIAAAERRGLEPPPDIERILDEYHRLVVAGLQVLEGQDVNDVYQRELSGRMMYSKEAFADVVRRFPDADSLRKSLDREAVRAAMSDASRQMHRRGAISAQLAERFSEAVWTEHKDADSIEVEAVAMLVEKLNVEVAAPYSLPPAKDLLAR